MSLKYEPSSEPLRISVRPWVGGTGVRGSGFIFGLRVSGFGFHFLLRDSGFRGSGFGFHFLGFGIRGFGVHFWASAFGVGFRDLSAGLCVRWREVLVFHAPRHHRLPRTQVIYEDLGYWAISGSRRARPATVLTAGGGTDVQGNSIQTTLL